MSVQETSQQASGSGYLQLKNELEAYRALILRTLQLKKTDSENSQEFHSLKAKCKSKMITIRRIYQDAQLALSEAKEAEDTKGIFVEYLNYQALAYEKNHLEKEINQCDEFETPNLAKAIDKSEYEKVGESSFDYIIGLEKTELENRKKKYEDFLQLQNTTKTEKAKVLKFKGTITPFAQLINCHCG